jgi:hypothetical protein
MQNCDYNLIEEIALSPYLLSLFKVIVNDNTILLLPNGNAIDKLNDFKFLSCYHPESKGGDEHGICSKA